MEKKERKPGYFARLKRRKQIKQNSENPSTDGTRLPVGRLNKETKTHLDSSKASRENKENTKDENAQQKNKRKELEVPEWSEQKKCSAVNNISHNKQNEKRKEKKMSIKQPLGTMEYIAGPDDTLNCIALKFNITPNRLVEINHLFSHTICPGQTLYVPDKTHTLTESNLASLSPGSPTSSLSSDTEYDKLSDAELARTSLKPIHRLLSSASEEEEPLTVKFLKMSCRYITDGKGVVGGVMIVTPNNIMFDPHKSDPLVIENGCEEYGLICPMEEVVSIALYNDISHMKIKDALPSDLPKDLCPLYRPGEWEDLSSEQDINPFSRFKAKSKEKQLTCLGETDISAKMSPSEEDFTVLGTPLHQQTKVITDHKTDCKPDVLQVKKDLAVSVDADVDIKHIFVSPSTFLEVEGTRAENELFKKQEKTEEIINGSKNTEQILLKENSFPEETSILEKANTDLTDKVVLDRCNNNPILNKSLIEDKASELSKDLQHSAKTTLDVSAQNGLCDTLNEVDHLLLSSSEKEIDNESEMKSSLLKKIQGPIEDMIPSKEQTSKKPPMFLCFKVGKPMRKSFAGLSSVPMQHYIRRGKQPEYWFAVPQERVDHLYTFFVQWSPEIYGKDAKEQGFIIVEKEELDMIDNFFSDPVPKSWEIITINEAKRRQSCGSYEDEQLEDLLPVLKDQSALLDDIHVEKLAAHLPARTQGYPWRLAYSTVLHGTSLKTLYRNMAELDSPVILVIKDMDNQVFGALASSPFRITDHCYGTGETFLFTFNTDLKVFHWSGEDSYFIKGDKDSLQLGAGGGHFGLWLDADLCRGCSSPCETFNNETLSKREDFVIQDLEIWTFD
ncbi:nuclear receptor coactivator 7-like isoform X3 [Erpetoichthys calabaricus]|uniref:nuclear receptor coactivator 7-like isoform X3 n=1 Tax=Erpetoichthys calabaricus TaxID=27687 RepID=UPI0010A08B45|nr:nuclear receptor coactivator 7-like isoform X3 [Erpetoichthys calabaricus]XP_051780764.1 nuclear receptor coactivator 7-like isoform X3 [Erpetoichthys calabaricus]